MFFDEHVVDKQKQDELSAADQLTDHTSGELPPGLPIFATIGAIIFGTITILMLFKGLPGALISLTDFDAADKVYFGVCVALIVLAIIPAILAKLCLSAAQTKKKAE